MNEFIHQLNDFKALFNQLQGHIVAGETKQAMVILDHVANRWEEAGQAKIFVHAHFSAAIQHSVVDSDHHHTIKAVLGHHMVQHAWNHDDHQHPEWTKLVGDCADLVAQKHPQSPELLHLVLQQCPNYNQAKTFLNCLIYNNIEAADILVDHIDLGSGDSFVLWKLSVSVPSVLQKMIQRATPEIWTHLNTDSNHDHILRRAVSEGASDSVALLINHSSEKAKRQAQGDSIGHNSIACFELLEGHLSLEDMADIIEAETHNLGEEMFLYLQQRHPSLVQLLNSPQKAMNGLMRCLTCGNDQLLPHFMAWCTDQEVELVHIKIHTTPDSDPQGAGEHFIQTRLLFDALRMQRIMAQEVDLPHRLRSAHKM